MPCRSRLCSSSTVTSTLTTSSARSRNVSGTVSRTRTPVTRLTASFSVSRCWMLTAVMHADAGVEQLQHVLIALLVPAAGGVGVRELVDDAQLRLARAGSRRRSISSSTTPRYSIFRRGTISRSPNLRLGVGAAVRLDEADRRRPRPRGEARARPRASSRSCRRRARRRCRCAAARAARSAASPAPARRSDGFVSGIDPIASAPIRTRSPSLRTLYGFRLRTLYGLLSALLRAHGADDGSVAKD